MELPESLQGKGDVTIKAMDQERCKRKKDTYKKTVNG
jgi:hypothetical protein